VLQLRRQQERLRVQQRRRRQQEQQLHPQPEQRPGQRRRPEQQERVLAQRREPERVQELLLFCRKRSGQKRQRGRRSGASVSWYLRKRFQKMATKRSR
jgi:hypothetical protein